MFKIIRRGKYSFDSKHWAGVTEEAIGLIVHLLEVDPSTRYTATQALQLNWIKSVEEPILEKHDLANSLTGLRKSNRLKNLARSVQWLNKEKHMSSLTVDTVGSGSASPA